MTCSRCGAEAAIRRDAAYYCGRCAVARDWGDVIAMVQDGQERVDVVFDAAEPENPEPASMPTGDPFSV